MHSMFNVCCPQERGKRALTAGNTAHPLHPNVTRQNESIREGMTMQMSNEMKENTRGFIQSNLFKHSVVTINVVIWDVLSPTCIHFKFALCKEFSLYFQLCDM